MAPNARSEGVEVEAFLLFSLANARQLDLWRLSPDILWTAVMLPFVDACFWPVGDRHLLETRRTILPPITGAGTGRWLAVTLAGGFIRIPVAI